MRKINRNDFFWPSYTDLMTSLFFIMLVLYVMSYTALKAQQRATEEQLQKIREIQKAVENLPEKYFQSQPEYKRFVIKRQIQFDIGSSIIKPTYYEYLNSVGSELKSLVNNLKVKYKSDNIKYLLVVEGMASEDNYKRNYELSYERSLSLYSLWYKNNIRFDPSICEVQIAGSGTGGLGRFSGKEEVKNQRFIIQIVPKIGVIK